VHSGESRGGAQKVYGEFVKRFVDRAKTLRVGDGLDPKVEMGPCINEQQLQTVMSYVEIGKKEGAKLLTGGNRLNSGAHSKGGFMSRRFSAMWIRKCALRRKRFLGPW